jgi:glycosyltransferase involved in cell wall biosynthesis
MTQLQQAKQALVLRAGPYDVTQAGPRAVAFLAEHGYEVTILAWDPNGAKPPQEEVKGGRVLWFNKAYPSGSIKFILYWFVWWAWVMRHLLKNRYAVVHAMNFEAVLPCALLRRLRGYKLVFDVRDAWGQSSSNRRFPIPQGFRIAERWTARHVDGLLLSQGRLDMMAGYFGRRVCRRIPTIQVLNVPEKDMAGAYLPPPLEKIRLNFSGHISYARNAAAILELAQRRPDVQIDVIGEIRNQVLRQEYEKQPNCVLYGKVPFEQAMELMKQCNLVAIMYDANTEIAIVSSANKMFESMMMSRPCIASARGFPGVVAEQLGVGFAVPYDDSEALIALVDRLRENPALVDQAAQRGREAYCQRFQWDVQKSNLQALYGYLQSGQQARWRQVDGWQRIIGTTFQMQGS